MLDQNLKINFHFNRKHVYLKEGLVSYLSNVNIKSIILYESLNI